MKSSINIFYVDDDVDDQDLFREAVAELNGACEVAVQNNGNELIAKLKSPLPIPDMIFLDLNMPGMNGYQALREIRDNDKTRYVPVIVFSTSDDDRAINTMRELGANLYIPKPTSYKAIKKVLHHSLAINWSLFETGDENFVYRVS